MPHLHKYRTVLAFGIIAFFVTILWFRSGLLIATGEENFTLFNNREPIQHNFMWGTTGTGYLSPFLLLRIPLSLLLEPLKNMGIPMWIIQATVFGSVLWCGMYAMRNLAKELLPESPHQTTVSIIAALFYLFNTYTMTSVWGRFLYTGIFSWAYLPLLLWLFLKWIRTQQKKYLFIHLSISILFTIAYSHPAFLITLWSPIGILFITESITSQNKLSILKSSIIFFISWMCISSWWLYPYLVLGRDAVDVVASNTNANYDTLRGVSTSFPLTTLIQLKENFFHGQQFYNGWYTSRLSMVMSIFVALITLVGLLNYRKYKVHIIVISMIIVAIVVTKGANPPFGEQLYTFVFQNLPFLQAFRNPYEKFGLNLLWPYAIFFAVGAHWLYTKLAFTKVIQYSFALFTGLTTLVLVWPIWTGDLFGANAANTRVEIPAYYAEFNQYLNTKPGIGRVLQLPMMPGEGVRYWWAKGYYQGAEPSAFFYDKAIISSIYHKRYFDQKYQNLFNKMKSRQSIEQDLQDLDVHYLFINHDLDYATNGAQPIPEVQAVLQQTPSVTRVRNFGNLELFTYTYPEAGTRFSVQPTNSVLYRVDRVSNLFYKVHITEATAPYQLIFKETFHHRWSAKIDHQVLTYHHVALEYANAWHINQTGNYTIEIRFNTW